MRNKPDQTSLQNGELHQSISWQKTGRLPRLAWLPIPVLLAFMAMLWAADLRTPYESPYLLMAMNFVFSTLASLLIVYLKFRMIVLKKEVNELCKQAGKLPPYTLNFEKEQP
jgi:hypothetical protein